MRCSLIVEEARCLEGTRELRLSSRLEIQVRRKFACHLSGEGIVTISGKLLCKEYGKFALFRQA